jgi:hypothetical protein
MEYTCCYQRCRGYKVGIRWQSQVFIQHENGGWEGIDFSAIFEVVSYLEEGSGGRGGLFCPFLKPFFKKGLKKVLCLVFWHQHHESSYLNLKFKLIFMFLHSTTLIVP